jgi:hypothetical protein
MPGVMSSETRMLSSRAPNCTRRPRRPSAALWVATLLIAAAPLGAQSLDRGDAAFLFAYRAKPERDAEFAQGYRRHLDWHAANRDTLAWLAWTVVDGPSIGTFVDGAFGIPLRAFDERVDPRGDSQDAATNVTAFAVPVDRGIYRLRRDLSTATRLERAEPAAMQRVVWLTLRPGADSTFELAARRVAAARSQLLEYAVYERLTGGEQPAYVMIAQFAAWSDLERPGSDPARALTRAAGASISRVQVETWLYLPQLTYVPRR